MLKKILENIQNIAKTAALIALLALGLYLYLNIRSCTKSVPQKTVNNVETPTDSSFIPVKKETYTPPTVPAIEKRRLPVRLPKGVTETDVKQVITVTERPAAKGSSQSKVPGHDIDIIETNDGEIYVEKDSTIESVTQIRVLPQFFTLEVGIALGANTSLDKRVRPQVSWSLGTWAGCVHFPVLTGDPDGISFGADTRVYHDFFLGAAYGIVPTGTARASLVFYF